MMYQLPYLDSPARVRASFFVTTNCFPQILRNFQGFPFIFSRFRYFSNYIGAVEVKCINLEGDNETVSTTKLKGLVTV